jgi:DivIVA domain-containing protein
MPFAPHEIENKKFVVGLRGYATHEVDAFLRAVAADFRALLGAAENASPERLMPEIELIMSSAREEAERLRTTSAAEAAAVREDAERDAAKLRKAAQREAEACFAEIARLHRLETAMWTRVDALEHTVAETRQTLAHVADLYPMENVSSNGHAYGDAPNVGAETNVEPAIAPR